jgi:hypothetical protein
MKRMKLVVMNNNHSHETHGSAGSDGSEGGGGGVGGGGGIYECDNCRTDFPNKTTLDRHALFCRTLADIRRGSGGGGGSGGVSMPTHNDPLMPTPREMFILIQELAAKYNKVKDELDVMKQWAKMVGRRVGAAAGAAAGGGAAVAAAGLDFTSIGRQKRQNMEVILNEEDAEHPDLAEARPSFAEWVATLDAMTRIDLNVVFNEDLVSGITAAILRVLSGHTAESGRSHLVPFKLADIKQGGFYIYDTAFKVVASAGVSGAAEFGQDPPTRRWRAMEPCEFQLMVRTFHGLLFKEFKKWQDENWEAQREMTKQRQKAASSYKQMMSVGGGVGVGGVGGGVGGSYQCSPAMASCDGMYWTPGGVTDADAHAADADIEEDVEPTTPLLSEDFATLYNKYADKMMGGALSDDTILTRVRAKLWKDMKAWRL